MERCSTCPHWQEAAEYDGMMCTLTESHYGEATEGKKAVATSNGGGHEWLITAPDFGLTEHPGNRSC